MHLYVTDIRRKNLASKQGRRHFQGRLFIAKLLKAMKGLKRPSLSGLQVTLRQSLQKAQISDTKIRDRFPIKLSMLS